MSIERVFAVAIIVLTLVGSAVFLYRVAEMSNQGVQAAAEYFREVGP